MSESEYFFQIIRLTHIRFENYLDLWPCMFIIPRYPSITLLFRWRMLLKWISCCWFFRQLFNILWLSNITCYARRWYIPMTTWQFPDVILLLLILNNKLCWSYKQNWWREQALFQHLLYWSISIFSRFYLFLFPINELLRHCFCTQFYSEKHIDCSFQ
jgi:hypothetical protein